MYVEISSAWNVLAGIFGILPVLAIPRSWEIIPETAEEKIDSALKTAAEAIKKEIVRLAEELFGDEFPEIDYATHNGGEPIIIKSAGLKLMPLIDYGLDDEVNMATDTVFYPPHTNHKRFELVLLPHGAYLAEEILVKLPSVRECGEYFPELGKTQELSATMYCALGKGIVAEIRRAVENRKLRKEMDAAAQTANQVTTGTATTPAIN